MRRTTIGTIAIAGMMIAMVGPAALQNVVTAQPPPGGRCEDDSNDANRKDLWVNVVGDKMCGDLTMANHFVKFGGVSSPEEVTTATGTSASGATTSGDSSSGSIAGGLQFGDTKLVSPAEGDLTFGGDAVCLDAGNCDFGDVNITETLKANKTVTGTAVVNESLSVGNESNTDDDTIFFDDGASEKLVWSDSADRYEISNDLHVFGSLTTSSSREFKTNITNLTGALQTVLELRGVEFDRIEDGRHEIGLIAEEVEKILPEVVVYDGDGDPIGLDYGRLVAVQAEAIEAQQDQIEDLREDIQTLQTPDEDLEDRVEKLEDRVADLEQRFEDHKEKSPGHAHGNE